MVTELQEGNQSFTQSKTSSIECDHLLGFIDGFEDEEAHLIYVSDKDRWYFTADWNETFLFCPLCGEKLEVI